MVVAISGWHLLVQAGLVGTRLCWRIFPDGHCPGPLSHYSPLSCSHHPLGDPIIVAVDVLQPLHPAIGMGLDDWDKFQDMFTIAS
jgi:hypothetical protein